MSRSMLTLPDRLTPGELAAWRGFLRVHAALARELDAELVDAHGLSLSAYDVLVTLENAPGERLRMNDLARSVLLSQSGLTRLVDRLQRDGLVTRTRCTDDRRGFWAALTAKGAATLATARPTHLAGVRERFLTRFDDDELATLARLWEKLVPGAAG